MAGLNEDRRGATEVELADRLENVGVPLSWGRTYHGRREPDGSCEVWVEEDEHQNLSDALVSQPTRRELSLHLEIRNHSPTGFEWGYGGSGPAQLALALLVDALGDVEVAEAHYQDFKREVISGLSASWTITAKQIREFVITRPERA